MSFPLQCIIEGKCLNLHIYEVHIMVWGYYLGGGAPLSVYCTNCMT